MPTTVNSSITSPTLSNSTSDILRITLEVLCTSVFDVLSEGISVHSESGEIVWANKKMCDIYHKPLSEIKGSLCQRLFHEEGTWCPHEQVLATGTAVELDREMRVAGRMFSLIIEPLFDEGGGVCGFVRVIRDVTDEHRAKDLLSKAERYASLGQILSGIAHDIGTPLNVISGYTEFLLMRTQPDGQSYKELSAILNQTRRIASMVGQALELARPPQGRADAIEISVLLADVLALVGHYLHKAKVKAGLTCRISPPLIYGEAPQLKQAFFNLLLNACHEVGAGGTLEVVVDQVSERPGFLSVAFSATEAGGVEHDFSQSLGCFLGAQGVGATPGVGLSLAGEILNAAGAKISFCGPEGRSVSLVIYLPVNHASSA